MAGRTKTQPAIASSAASGLRRRPRRSVKVAMVSSLVQAGPRSPISPHPGATRHPSPAARGRRNEGEGCFTEKPLVYPTLIRL